MNIQNLPQELKLEIWSFLNYHDLCISERVCKEWLDLMRNNETDLWKKSYQTSFGSPVLLPLVCPWKSFVRKGHLINHSPATNHQSIILDISTNKVKVGLTHEKEPSVILKSDDVDLDEYINLYKLDSTTSLDLKNPNIKTYIVLIDMGLRAVPALLDHHPVCILLNTKTTRLIKEFLAYFMFEHYRVVALQLKPSRSTYITICEDRRNSVVVKIGNEETVITAFHDGWELTHTTIILPIGGKTITYKLLELLNHRKDLPDLIKNFECVNTIKEKLAFVSIDPESDRFKFSCYGNQLFMSLFDGSTVELRSESFECCEVLFQSTGEEPSGLIQGIKKCISKCDESLQRDAWSNVILAGDTTLLNGLQHRIRRELVTCTNLYVDVISAQRHSSWKGACKFSETEYYWNQLVSKEEYEELGPSAFWPRYF